MISMKDYLKSLSEAKGDDESGDEDPPDEGASDDTKGAEAELNPEGVDTRPSLDAKVDSELNQYMKSTNEPKEGGMTQEGYRTWTLSMLAEGADGRINMEAFAGDVARLIENFTDIIDVKTVIIKRAVALVSEKYGTEGGDELLDCLRAGHGMSADETEDDLERSNMAPLAVGAGPLGG